jgi:hypothetical protein
VTLVLALAERALLLAQDPVPNDAAAAAELRRLVGHAPAPGSILLAAMTAAWDRVEDLSGDGLVLAGRALLLLGMAIDQPRR